MFGPQAPIWTFLETLGAKKNPEIARMAIQGLHLMEVFPALALPSLEGKFFGRLKGPRYNPSRRKTFRTNDWCAVITAARHEAKRFDCNCLAKWLSQLGAKGKPKKSDQDRLDAVICLLAAIRWRLGMREESIMLGDLQNGYMVAPVSSEVMARLSGRAKLLGVPVDALAGGGREPLSADRS